MVRDVGKEQVADPHGLAIVPDGRVLLVDRDAHQVLVFTADGEQVGAIGTRHRPRFQAPFNHPTGVAVAPEGEIYVSDGYGNPVVHRFAADGTHLTESTQIARRGAPVTSDLNWGDPSTIAR